MKRIIIAITLLATVSLFACKSNMSRNNISLKTSDHKTMLNFTATYPSGKTAQMQHYMEDILQEKRIFKDVDDKKKAEIRLADGTHFLINYEPGYMEINFQKTDNSYSAYAKMKKLCAGFANVLKD
jgi:hypothetical protein